MKHEIIKFDIIESTNTEALSNDYPDGSVICAKFQTRGRGQRGNVWNAENSQNLTFSLVSYPGRSLLDSYPISMSAALSVVRTLRLYNIDARIKWPNDIYVGDLKIAGILIENSLKGTDMIYKSVTGIGLNVSQTKFPSSLPNPTSMSLCGVSDTPDNVLDRFIAVYDEVMSLSDDQLYHQYMNHLWRAKGYYPYIDESGRFMAEIVSVNPHTGRLTLRRENDNVLVSYYFKEVQALLK